MTRRSAPKADTYVFCLETLLSPSEIALPRFTETGEMWWQQPEGRKT